MRSVLVGTFPRLMYIRRERASVTCSPFHPSRLNQISHSTKQAQTPSAALAIVSERVPEHLSTAPDPWTDIWVESSVLTNTSDRRRRAPLLSVRTFTNLAAYSKNSCDNTTSNDEPITRTLRSRTIKIGPSTSQQPGTSTTKRTYSDISDSATDYDNDTSDNSNDDITTATPATSATLATPATPVTPVTPAPPAFARDSEGLSTNGVESVGALHPADRRILGIS